MALISRRGVDVNSHEGLEKCEQGQVMSVSADVVKMGELQTAMSKIREAYGNIDFLFTCAGLSRNAMIEDLSDDQVRQQIEVNLIGTINAVKLVIPEQKERESGRVCLISSVGGQIGLWGMTTYCASKFALKGLGEALQMELIDTDVAVTIVYPPDMTTPGLEEENKTKPDITKKIGEMADEVHPDSIVKGLIHAVECGQVDYSVGIDGWFAARCNVGLGPASSCLNLLSELVLSNLFRLIALVYRKLILRVIRSGLKKTQ